MEAIHGQLGIVDYSSPRDSVGHGTHVASIAAGKEVSSASLFGFASGTARGVAPKARIAMYKVFWLVEDGKKSTSSDILAAMDRAVQDGVDCLSLSIGLDPEEPYHKNIIALNAFNAMRKGVFVSAAAGNYGGFPSSVMNTAPWMTTVAAGTIDRVFTGKSFSKMGKIVVCHDNALLDLIGIGFQVKAMGGVGLLEVTKSEEDDDIPFIAIDLPGLLLNFKESMRIISYFNTTNNPTGRFFIEEPTVLGRERTPRVAPFSSKGPNPIVLEILKPDIVASGDNILAAWIPIKPVDVEDPRRAAFNILSGTSMSCPHVAAVAALLHSAHPTWSPAGIRSAMMTTSRILDNYDRPIVGKIDWKPESPLTFGAGHVNPERALDPGLIYDAGLNDYVNLLCSLNYTREQLQMFVQGPVSCVKGQPGDLNYPSSSETYTVTVINQKPEKVAILVQPTKLTFEKIYQKHTYEVKLESKFNGTSEEEETEFAYIVWESDMHFVRIPVVFMWRRVR
ncbi:hypothetical protein NE237_018636 [Protea cynaroides]|uniref:Uncharacterized protein n=1 Tax=Protea cynaroides TaxID=273540 RepID=A0A9Q0KAC4_9MAGN|nr:hypothetical protein NE237_018636 [Protea cynaroides]